MTIYVDAYLLDFLKEILVPRTGVEPARLSAVEPKSTASTSSANGASEQGLYHGLVYPRKSWEEAIARAFKEDALSHNQMPSGAAPPPLDEVDLECELEVSGGKPLVLPLAPTLQHSTQLEPPRQLNVSNVYPEDCRQREHWDVALGLHQLHKHFTLPGKLDFAFWYDTRGYFYAQVYEIDTYDNTTGLPLDTWYGRKWLLSPHMTDSEIVQTVFKAVMTAVEHEVREQFKYKGESVFDPHYDLEKLVEMRRAGAESKRMGKAESRRT